jgi:hypothetical protein
LARRMKTAQQARARYTKGVTQAGPDYTAGIQNSSSWVEGALAAKQRRDTGLQQAIADGRIDAGIQNKGDAGWKTATLAKGPTNYTQSVATAGPAYEAGMNRAMQYQQAAQSATANMDTSTRAGRIAKMAAYVNAVADAAQQAKTGR